MKSRIAVFLLLFTLVACAGETPVTAKPVAIANGASLSAAVDLQNWNAVAIVMPAAWTAANLTFQCSVDGTTFADLYDDTGTEYTATVAASRVITLSAADFTPCRKIKIRSGTAAVPVNQGAARALIVAARGY